MLNCVADCRSLPTMASGCEPLPRRFGIVKEAPNPWYEMTLIEGRNRQIRRMFEEVGHHVEKIKRVKYGPLALDVPPGKFRALTKQEVDRLRTSPDNPRLHQN